jgi:CRP-like cAMP-binding protein
MTPQTEKRRTPLVPVAGLDGDGSTVQQIRMQQRTSQGADRLSAAALLTIDDGVVLVVRPCTRCVRRRMVLAVCGSGSLLAPPRGAERIVALTDAVMTAVAPEAMRELLTAPETAAVIASGLLETVRERHETIAQLGRAPHGERLRERLLELARRHGRVVAGGVRIDLPLTHELLAQMICSARETVTLGLRDLEREGFLVREGRSYRLRIVPESLV